MCPGVRSRPGRPTEPTTLPVAVIGAGLSATRLQVDDDQVTVVSSDPAGTGQRIAVDRVVVATGYRPDHSIVGELRLDLDPVLGSTRALAPLIDPNEHGRRRPGRGLGRGPYRAVGATRDRRLLHRSGHRRAAFRRRQHGLLRLIVDRTVPQRS